MFHVFGRAEVLVLVWVSLRQKLELLLVHEVKLHIVVVALLNYLLRRVLVSSIKFFNHCSLMLLGQEQ